jgi:hypothetical protein
MAAAHPVAMGLRKLGADAGPHEPQPRCGVVIEAHKAKRQLQAQHTPELGSAGSDGANKSDFADGSSSSIFVFLEAVVGRY